METGQCSIDYYLCKDFVLISRKNDYYSSWVLTAGYSDVLYSTMEDLKYNGPKKGEE